MTPGHASDLLRTLEGAVWGRPFPAAKPRGFARSMKVSTWNMHWGAFLALALWAPWANAQATRTWVSGVGDDANPCSRTAPCRTFGAALAKTASGGEIDALDPGDFDFVYDYTAAPGTVTYTPLVINKPITIDGGAGRVSGLGPLQPALNGGETLVVASQQDAIVIDIPSASAGPVILRNLSLNGASGVGRNGIRVASAKTVNIHNVDVAHFSQNCLSVDATAAGALIDIADSAFTHCSTGVAAAGSAFVNLGDSTVTMNSGTGLATSSPQATILASGSSVIGNVQNTSFLTFTAPTPAVPGGNGVPGVPAGSATATISGGGAGCSFASQQFISPGTVAGGPPSPAVATQAGFRFDTNNCGAGATVSISLTYSQAMPAGTVLYKYGPALPGAAVSTWFAVPGVSLSADRTTFTYTITDNGVGDSNPASGFISDPVVPVLPGALAIPTLSEYGLMLLAGLMGMAGLAVVRRRQQR